MASNDQDYRSGMAGSGAGVMNLGHHQDTIDWKARFDELAAAGDVIAHELSYSQHPVILERWWMLRGGREACTVCSYSVPQEGESL